mmetsp:Transcript_6617/g.10555  ORF Transcript_6617/g.10555 Transcript_6617/m.10555 type:complete len:401 (+) Transcript_6617:403-1605(+)
MFPDVPIFGHQSSQPMSFDVRICRLSPHHLFTSSATTHHRVACNMQHAMHHITQRPAPCAFLFILIPYMLITFLTNTPNTNHQPPTLSTSTTTSSTCTSTSSETNLFIFISHHTEIMSGMELLLQATGRSDGVRSTDSSANSTTDKHTMLHSNFVTAANKISRSDSDSKSSLPPKKRMKFNFDNASCVSMSESSFQRTGSSDTSLSSSWMSVASRSSTIASHSSDCITNSPTPTQNSEWTETMTTEMMMRPQGDLLQLGNSVIVPKRKKGGSGHSSKKSNSSVKRQLYDSSVNTKAASKKKESSFIKDVNGNDMCMGYFSMPSRKLSPAPAEEQPLPTTVNPQDVTQEELKPLPTNEVIMPHSTKAAAVITIPDSQAAQIAAKSLLYQAYLQALNQSTNQ